MRFCILGSGSKGNSIWVESGDGAVLVDSGLSWKSLKARMDDAGLDRRRLAAILLTHEHSDHSRGVAAAARAAGVPVLATAGTLSAWSRTLGPRSSRLDAVTIEPGRPCTAGGLILHPFTTSHDVAQPVMFVIESNGSRLGIATDLGVPTRLVQERLAGCNGLVLEFNHDPEMLWSGPYPWPLKQRIRSRLGHLSNSQAAELLDRLYHPRLEVVVTAHLSEVNNRPDLALGSARMALGGRTVELVAARQDKPTRVFEL